MRRLPANLLIATVCVLFSFSGHCERGAMADPGGEIRRCHSRAGGHDPTLLGRIVAQYLTEV